MEKISLRMKRLREEQGLSLKEVAQRAQVAVSTYREWEYGREIQGEPYVRIAQALNVGLYELLTGEKSKLTVIFSELAEINEACKKIRRSLESFE